MLLSLLVLATLVSRCHVYAATHNFTRDQISRIMMADWLKTTVHKAYRIHKKDADYMQKAPTVRPTVLATVPGTRQECRTLDEDTRQRTFDCIKKMFTARTPSGLDFMYTLFEKYHRRSMSPGAHGGCCFLPWHRQYLARFEQAGRDVCGDPGFNLCYWDLTLDSEMPSPCESAIFSEFFYGNANGSVVSGFAANKQCLDDCAESLGSTLSRVCGGDGSLHSTEEADELVDCPDFRTLVMPFRGSFAEAFHNSIHMYVGGHMSYITCAPCDPLFFAYHAWIDYLWAQQQDRQNQSSDPGKGYPTDIGVPQYHKANDKMVPFDRLCRDGIRYPSPYTPYSPSPRTCRDHGDCNGGALWCNGGRCMGCVGPGGTMDPDWPQEACYIQTCQHRVNRDGICTCEEESMTSVTSMTHEATTSL